jgi:hypothetical protein
MLIARWPIRMQIATVGLKPYVWCSNWQLGDINVVVPDRPALENQFVV